MKRCEFSIQVKMFNGCSLSYLSAVEAQNINLLSFSVKLSSTYQIFIFMSIINKRLFLSPTCLLLFLILFIF